MRALTLVIALIMLLPSAPNASPDDTTIRLKDGTRYRLYLRDGNLRVSRRGQSVPIAEAGLPSGIGVFTATLRHNQTQVEIIATTYLSGDHSITIPIAILESRLENGRALKLHRKKQYRAAAKGFARAVELDPNFSLAITNLASAQALMGNVRAAESTIRPLLALAPLKTYHKVWSDNELAGLRLTATLKAVKAKTVGNAALNVLGQFPSSTVAYSVEKGLLAATIAEPAGGADCTTAASFIVVKRTTGAVVFKAPIVTYAEAYSDSCPLNQVARPSKRKRVQQRLVVINRLLTDFGFEQSKGMSGQFAEGEYRKLYISGAKLGVVIGESTIRVCRTGKKIAEKRQRVDALNGALFVPQASVLLVWWSFDPAHNDDFAGLSVFRLSEQK